MDKVKLIILSGFCIGLIYISFFCFRNNLKKSISFSNKDKIDYIPTNSEMSEYKKDLYYSIYELNTFKQELRDEMNYNSYLF